MTPPSKPPANLNKPILTISLPSTCTSSSTPKQRCYLLIRPFLLTDAADLVYHANNPRITANMRNSFPSPYTPSAAEWWINHCINSEDGRAPAFEGRDVQGDASWDGRLCCDYAVALVDASSSSPSSGTGTAAGEQEDLGRFIGAIGLKFNSTGDVHGQTAELGYWLGEEFWGRGWMTLIVDAFVGWVWKTWDFDVDVDVDVDVEAAKSRLLENGRGVESGGSAANSPETEDAQLKGVKAGEVATAWRARGIDRLEAAVYAWNGCGSDRVLEKCGFLKEGVLRGKVCKVVGGVSKRGDLIVYGILRP